MVGRLLQTTPYDTKHMANTFGILSALVLAFSAFVAFKNKEEFELQKQATISQENSRKVNTKTFDGLVASITTLEEDKATADTCLLYTSPSPRDRG